MREKTGGKTLYYTGPSMNPTLKAGASLYLTPYNGQKIKRGDVIVFHHPTDEKLITHRVLSVHSSGIRARGDNNSLIDPWILSPEQIVGKVIHAQRGRIKRRMFGGFLGHLYAKLIRTFRRVKAWLILLLRPFYSWLLHKGFLRRWFSFHKRIKVISFDRPAGKELHLLFRRTVIGRLQPKQNRWQINRPFRLLIDEACLPHREKMG